MKQKRTLQQVMMICLILASLNGAAKVTRYADVKKKYLPQSTISPARASQMTNQEFYTRLAGISDSLNTIYSTLYSKIVIVIRSKKWAAVSKDRKNLEKFCSQNLNYLANQADVGDSKDFREALIRLLVIYQNIGVNLNDFDGFDKNTQIIDIADTLNKILPNMDKAKPQQALFLAAKTAYAKAYNLN